MPRRIEARGAVEVYATKSGQIVVRQEDTFGNDPALVFLDPQDVPTVAKWLHDVAKDAEEIREANFAEQEEEQAGA